MSGIAMKYRVTVFALLLAGARLLWAPDWPDLDRGLRGCLKTQTREGERPREPKYLG